MNALSETDLDALIESYTVEDKVFTVTLPRGETLTFRTIPTYGAMQEFLEGAGAWWSVFSKSELGNGLSMKEGLFVRMVSELSVDPKVSQARAVKMLRCVSVATHIMSEIDRANSYQAMAADVGQAEALKNDSRETDGGAHCSPSRESRSTGTRTRCQGKSASGS